MTREAGAPARKTKSALRVIVEPLAAAILLALLVRACANVYVIPSASMEPTLYEGDYVLATRYLVGDPSRGEVVVFHSPADRDQILVKRVIGIPGDLIQSAGARVTIGGHDLSEPYVRMPAGPPIPPQIVAPGSYFVMGDNRANSTDSRSWGVVPRADIAGRVRIAIWSRANADHRRVLRAVH